MTITYKFEEYYRPDSLKQAIKVLNLYGDKGEVIAGGTDLLHQRPGGHIAGNGKYLVDITHMGLDYIKESKDGIHIGAAATINSIGAFHLFLTSPYLALSQAADCHSTLTIRNRATIGGNLCNASPCADFGPPLLALDAWLTITGPNGDRQIPMQDFYSGVNLCSLDSNEILNEIFIPFCKGRAAASFEKLGRQQTAIDMALVNTAVSLTMEKGRCSRVRIAVGATGPVPFRAEHAESILAGKIPDSEMIQQAAEAAAEASAPIDDIRATAEYRNKMVKVFVRKALENSLGRCKA